MEKMKIAVLGTRGFPNIQGGVEAHCENLYPLLAKQGCEVDVFVRKPYTGLKAPAEYKGVKLIPLACPKNKFLETFLHTFLGVFAAKKLKPDILHIHAVGPSLFAPLACILGMKVVMTNHGPDYERKKWGKLAKITLRTGEKLGSRWSEGIISISENIGERIREKYHRDVAVIPNGVKPANIQETEETLKKYGLTKQKYILAVGRFVPEKGFHDLIDAFLLLNTKDWKLVIVGKADHEDYYSANLRKKASGNENIILTGFLSGQPLEELFTHAGLFVIPSYYEGLPIVLLEAMSYGLPCLASEIDANKCAGLSEERFFKPGDVFDMVYKMKAFMGRQLSEEEKKKQRELMEQNYSWDNIAQKTLELYRKVVNI